ncbi:hypothetical protein CMEL01_11764 [Colletotrichum melonis]|uniref:Uncharacterized protein n=1 Tax=Colletotrichum melonis TaxID=1209925 RepID=A0AAI9UW01_9PEZI|nr:hypothetical protein CMEL01_11764 [Colletotrichum melonis]
MCLPAQFLFPTTSCQTALRKPLKPAAHYLTTCHIFSFPFLPFPSAQGAQVGFFFFFFFFFLLNHTILHAPTTTTKKQVNPTSNTQGHQKAPPLCTTTGPPPKPNPRAQRTQRT